MKRILHIVHVLSRGGGLTNFIMNYYRQIDRTAIQFDFIYFKEVDADFKDEISLLGGKYYKFEEPSLAGDNSLKDAHAFFGSHQNIYNAVHCHVLYAAAIYGPIARKYGVENVIQHSHSIGYGKGLLRTFRNYLLVKRGVSVADHYLACSLDSAKFMFGKKAVEKGEVEIIPNAIDMDKYLFDVNIRQEIRNELSIPEDAFVLAHVGGFVKSKNHDFIVRVFYKIQAIYPNAFLLLIGGEGTVGSTLSEIKDQIENMGIKDKVMLLGIRTDVNHLLMASDSFIFPSIFEGFGIVAIEAQATGLPIFVSENIPNDIKCTELVETLSLQQDPSIWAKEILDKGKLKINRSDYAEKIPNFDISIQKTKLESFYLSL